MQAALQKTAYIESVDTKTAAGLMGITERAVQMKVGQGILAAAPTIGTGGNAGTSFRIPVTSLPAEAQMRWRAMQAGKATDVDLTTYKERKAQAAVDKLQISRRARVEEKRIREEAGRAVMNELQTKVSLIRNNNSL